MPREGTSKQKRKGGEMMSGRSVIWKTDLVKARARVRARVRVRVRVRARVGVRDWD